MNIIGFEKLTLVDYPEKVAAILFTGGCNMRCPYCHNGELVLHPDLFPPFSDDEIFASYVETFSAFAERNGMEFSAYMEYLLENGTYFWIHEERKIIWDMYILFVTVRPCGTWKIKSAGQRIFR